MATTSNWPTGGIVATLAVSSSIVKGDITLDGTLGQTEALTGPNYEITASMGAQTGDNLFHSFGQFTIDTAERATFTGPDSVERVIGRVTGGQSSWIDGTLRNQIPNADLYLINPAGISLGPNASLDISGSVYFSTADYLGFQDGQRFDVQGVQAPLLTSAEPSTFGFVSDHLGEITVTGNQLQIPAGETLALVGGDVSIERATLSAPGGQIALLATTSGEIQVDRGTFQSNTVGQGEVILSDRSQLDVSHTGGGRVFIRSGQLQIQESLVQANTHGDKKGLGVDIQVADRISMRNRGAVTCGDIQCGRIISSTSGSGDAGDIWVYAEHLDMDNGRLFSETKDSAEHTEQPSGNAADIHVQVKSLNMIESARIISETAGSGDGGLIDINATQSLSIRDYRTNTSGITAIVADTAGSGNGGKIEVDTPTLSIDGGWIRSEAERTGNAGEIDIDVDTLIMRPFYEGSRAKITVATSGSGDAGSLTIRASTIDAEAGRIFASGFIYGNATVDELGHGGDVTVHADKILMKEGTQISSRTEGAGDGGNVTVTASESIEIRGEDIIGDLSGLRTKSEYSGNAGHIAVSAPTIILQGSEISAQSTGTGSAGDILVEAYDRIHSTDSQITTESDALDGGNISVNARKSIHLVNSKITTSVKAGAGDGGDINIDPVFVVLDASDILANAHDGNGGDIEIITNHLIKTPDSVIKASSVKGVDGRIQINAPDSQINGELSSAPIEFLNAAAILPQPCSARVGDDTIRLVHKHRLRADSPYALRVHLPIHQDESRSTHSVVDLAHIPKLQTYTKQPWECNADG